MKTTICPARLAGWRAPVVLAAALGLSFLGAGMASAGSNFPGSGGPAYTSDPATGYPCVDNWCNTVRLPHTNCICTKGNPAAQKAQDAHLNCITRENGLWVACPVKPRYGG